VEIREGVGTLAVERITVETKTASPKLSHAGILVARFLFSFSRQLPRATWVST
jgi:hypothetical protein